MIEHLDGFDLYNTVQLQLAADSAKILVVEGEEDYDLLLEFFEETPVELLPGYGKLVSLEAASLSEGDKDTVRYLIDADFDRITGAAAAYPSKVVATDLYDLVLDIASANHDVLKRIARLNSQGASPAGPHEQVELAVKAAAHVGAVRFASMQETWNLNMKVFPIHLCLPGAISGEVDELQAETLAVSRTPGVAVPVETVTHHVRAKKASIPDVWMLVNGHDLLAALTHVGRTFAGAKAKTDYTMQFQLAVGRAELMSVRAIREIHEWAIAA